MKRLTRSAILGALMIGATPLCWGQGGYSATESDITYGIGLRADGLTQSANTQLVSLKMDRYAPQDGTCDPANPDPFMVLVHGGAFTTGSKTDENLVDVAFRGTDSTNDYTVFSLDYRLLEANETTGALAWIPIPSTGYYSIAVDQLIDAGLFPPVGLTGPEALTVGRIYGSASAVEDVTKAINFIISKDTDYCIDPDNYVILGSSAGSTVSHYVTYGLDDIAVTGLTHEPTAYVDFWGKEIFDDLMSVGDPPLFILHGDADTLIDYSLAEAMRDEATSNSIGNSFFTVEERGHNWCQMEPEVITIGNGTNVVMDAVMFFVRRHLNGKNYNYRTRTMSPGPKTC